MYGPFIMQKKEEGGIPMAGRKPKPTAVAYGASQRPVLRSKTAEMRS